MITFDNIYCSVAQVFSNVARSYDIMNDVMSVGIHRVWKDSFVSSIAPTSTSKLLDVAGGSGDIAFRLLDHVKVHHKDNTRVECTVLDINDDMLDIGRQRALQNGYGHCTDWWLVFYRSNWQVNLLRFVQGNAEDLIGIASDSLDSYTISFGIRNCTHIEKVTFIVHQSIHEHIQTLYQSYCLYFTIPNHQLQMQLDLLETCTYFYSTLLILFLLVVHLMICFMK